MMSNPRGTVPDASSSTSYQQYIREVFRDIYGTKLRPLFAVTGPRKGRLLHVAMREQARELGYGWCSRCWRHGLKGHLTKVPAEQGRFAVACKAALARSRSGSNVVPRSL